MENVSGIPSVNVSKYLPRCFRSVPVDVTLWLLHYTSKRTGRKGNEHSLLAYLRKKRAYEITM
jgi:hypothetical protein